MFYMIPISVLCPRNCTVSVDGKLVLELNKHGCVVWCCVDSKCNGNVHGRSTGIE